MLCQCNAVCFDREFPGLPPQGACRRDCVFGEPRECGCKSACIHDFSGMREYVTAAREHRHMSGHWPECHDRLNEIGPCSDDAYILPQYRVSGTEPMMGMHSMDDDMIPRITLRSADDAILIIQALRTHQHARADVLEREAKRPGADQFALALQHIEETQNVINLMSAITDGIMPATLDPTEQQARDRVMERFSATETEEN